MVLRCLTFALLAALLLPSCSWNWCFWKKRKPKFDKGVIQVRVVPASAGKGIPVRARAYEADEGERGDLVANHPVSGDGVVGFVLPMGEEYIIEAHADLDADGRRDRGEPWVEMVGVQPHDLLAPDPGPTPLRLPVSGAVPRSHPAPERQEAPMPGLGLPSILDQLREQAPGLLRDATR